MGIGDQYGWVTLADGTSVPPNDPRALQYYNSDQAAFMRSNPNYDPTNGNNSVTGSDGLNHGQGSAQTPVTSGDQIRQNPNAPQSSNGTQGNPDGSGDGAGFGGGGNTLGFSYAVPGGEHPPNGSRGTMSIPDAGKNADFIAWVHKNAPQSFDGKYEVQQGETPQQWMDRVSNAGGDGANFINRIKGQASFAPFLPPQANGAQPLDRNEAVNSFYRMMMNPNDPALVAAQKAAMGTAQQNLEGRGIGGGLAAASATKVGLDSYNANALQRQQAGMAALGQGMNYDANLAAHTWDQNQSSGINQQNNSTRDLNTGLAAAGQGINAASRFIPTGGSSSPGGGGMTQQNPNVNSNIQPYQSTSPSPTGPAPDTSTAGDYTEDNSGAA